MLVCLYLCEAYHRGEISVCACLFVAVWGIPQRRNKYCVLVCLYLCEAYHRGEIINVCAGLLVAVWGIPQRGNDKSMCWFVGSCVRCTTEGK